MNLLSNAFKFTPDGGRVDVALEMSKEMSGRLLIKVSDTGVGIRDEDKERIFERFYQVEQEEPEHQSTGSGIGLRLVRDFVTLHEGTVRVVDNVGSGSVFLVELPVKHVRVSPPKPAPLTEEVSELVFPYTVSFQWSGSLAENIGTDAGYYCQRRNDARDGWE